MSANSYRILALDVDGTLLDSRGELAPRTAEAVARAARAGLRPVLCTGRRYRRARPIAESLGLDTPVVCNSGALVKDPATDRTLWRAGFDAALVAELLGVFRDCGEFALSFTDRPTADYDFLIERDPLGCPLFDEYLSRNRPHGRVDASWPERLADGEHFHICAMGSRAAMLACERAVLDRLGSRVRTFVQRSPHYAATMCEVVRSDAGKWTAVLHLAELWNVAPEEICAVGDDVNDVPMLRGAGLGVAMHHAPPEVRAAADRILDADDPDVVACLIEELLRIS